MRVATTSLVAVLLLAPALAQAQRYTGPDGRLRVALARQPYAPNGVTRPDDHGRGGDPADPGGPGRADPHRGGGLEPPLRDEHVVMAGVRLTDPLERRLLDSSRIEQISVDDLRNLTPAVFAQLDRLSRITDRIYVHIDMDVLDPREVMGHGNRVPNGPSSEQLARLFEEIFRRYPTASAIGFATIPATDEGGLSLAAVNRMIAGAVRGVMAREARR